MTFENIAKVDNNVGTDEIEKLLKQAKADVPTREAEHRKTEGALARAESERMRIEKLRGTAQATAKRLFEKQRAEKRRHFESMTNEVTDEKSWTEYLDTKSARQKVLDQLSYLTSWSIEDALRACIVAEISERSAYADYLESVAVTKRLSLQVLSVAALAADEGAVISLQDQTDPERGPSSASTKLAKEVTRLRTVDIKQLELRLRDHDRRVEHERGLVGDQVFA